LQISAWFLVGSWSALLLMVNLRQLSPAAAATDLFDQPQPDFADLDTSLDILQAMAVSGIFFTEKCCYE
jgi:hypothetical protein